MSSEICRKGSGYSARSLKDRIEDEEGGTKKKRNLIAELTEGFVALADQRTGKRTLRTHVVQTKAAPKMSAKELSAGLPNCIKKWCRNPDSNWGPTHYKSGHSKHVYFMAFDAII
jgi:hypothetical protein